jgi:hypothetical protein
MTSTFDLLTVDAVFVDIKSFAVYESLKTNKPVEIPYRHPE